MDLQLNGKRAPITGSTLGIGLAIARALAGEGVHITVNGRTEERVREARQRIATEIPNGKIAVVAADLSSSDGVTRIIEACPEIWRNSFLKRLARRPLSKDSYGLKRWLLLLRMSAVRYRQQQTALP